MNLFWGDIAVQSAGLLWCAEHGKPWGRRRKGYLFDDYIESLVAQVYSLITRCGCKKFICGMESEIALDFAKTVLFYRDSGTAENITLECVSSCQNQKVKAYQSAQKKCGELLKLADKITHISINRTCDCRENRDKYIVDNSDIILAYCNKPNVPHSPAIAYAMQQNKLIDYLN